MPPESMAIAAEKGSESTPDQVFEPLKNAQTLFGQARCKCR
jgi:hypothetical protein